MKSFCRTCFKETTDNTSISLDLENRNKYQLLVDILRYCVPEMNLGAVPDAKLCKECVTTLKVTYKFRIKCLEVEDKINRTNRINSVCRTCLVDIDDRFIFLIEGPFYRRKLTICVPEMDLRVASEINLCKDCYTILDIVYKFKMKCLVVEKNIKEYLQLHSFVDFTKLSVWCSIFVENEMNNFEDFTIKQEEVDLSADEITGNLQKNVVNFKFVSVKNEELKSDECSEPKPSKNHKRQRNTTKNNEIKSEIGKERHRSRTQNRFKCSQCKYSTMQKCHIDAHMRTHTGEKPFKCFHCGYETAQKPNLERHILTHSDEKPFKCSHCAYGAKQKSTLQDHLRRHTGEKPFKCSVCELTFAHRRTYKIHMLSHVDKKQLGNKIRHGDETV